MYTRLRNRFFALQHDYRNPIERQRAFGLLLMNWALAAAWLVWLVLVVSPLLLGLPGALSFVAIPLTAIPIVVFLTYTFIQRGMLRWASWLFVGVLTVGIIPPIIGQFSAPDTPMTVNALLIIPLVAAGLILNRRETSWFALALLLIVGLRAFIQSRIETPVTIYPAEQVGVDLLLMATGFILAYAFLYLFNGSATRLNQIALQENAFMREAAAYVNAVKDSPDETALLARSIDVLRDRMKYPVSQIFLFNEEGGLMRRMRSGLGKQEVGAVIKLRPADEEVLAEVRGSRSIVVVHSGDLRQGHLIAPARAAATIPIIYRGWVMGALDVQSNKSSFSENELTALSLLADQLGAQLSQLRALTDLQLALRDQADAAARFQSQLFEMRRTAEKVIGSDWTRYLEGRAQMAFGFDLAREHVSGDLRPVPAYDVPEALRPALERGEVVVEQTDFEQVISIPIIFRGETLGAMSFAVPKDKPLNERQLDMARTVADRLAVALENTRLFEQTQAQAYRERKASEAASTLIGATDVRAVISVAAETFNEAMGAVFTRVYLQPDLIAEPAARARGGEVS